MGKATIRKMPIENLTVGQLKRELEAPPAKLLLLGGAREVAIGPEMVAIQGNAPDAAKTLQPQTDSASTPADSGFTSSSSETTKIIDSASESVSHDKPASSARSLMVGLQQSIGLLELEVSKLQAKLKNARNEMVQADQEQKRAQISYDKKQERVIVISDSHIAALRMFRSAYQEQDNAFKVFQSKQENLTDLINASDKPLSAQERLSYVRKLRAGQESLHQAYGRAMQLKAKTLELQSAVEEVRGREVKAENDLKSATTILQDANKKFNFAHKHLKQIEQNLAETRTDLHGKREACQKIRGQQAAKAIAFGRIWENRTQKKLTSAPQSEVASLENKIVAC